MVEIESLYSDFLNEREEQSLKRQLIRVEQADSCSITVKGRNYNNFSSNDYLGLSRHPKLIRGAQDWAQKYGAGTGASRLVTGNIKPFNKLEDKIAQFKETESALIMVSGYQANVSIIPALLDQKVLKQKPIVFSDKLNHASMHAGCAAASVTQTRYRHNDMDHLKELLEKHKDNLAPKFILTESIFSMDGDVAPLDDIKKLAAEYNCFTIIDEAHATGVFGDNGQGLAKGFDVVIGTFSKAMGSFGAYVACSKKIKEYLVNKCGGLIYATALPPAILGSIDTALNLVPTMHDERHKLHGMSEYVRQKCKKMGFDTAASTTQIIPIIVGDSESSLSFSNHLKENNIWINAIRTPTVPKNEARLRIVLSSAHTADQIDHLLHAMSQFKFSKAA